MLYEHVDTAVIDGESLPWIPFTPYAQNVLLKYFKLDPIRGEWIVMMKSPIDMQLPKHHHTGTVMVYTIEGQWKYKEHDWIAGPGQHHDLVPPHVPKVRETVQQDDERTLPLVDVMHANAVEFGKAVVECIRVVGVHLRPCRERLADTCSGVRAHYLPPSLLSLSA